MMFAENLRNIRKRNGLSQEDIAQKLEVTRQTISRYETGDATPDLKKITKLTQVFSVSFDQLLGSASNDKKEGSPRNYTASSSENRLTIMSTISSRMASYYKFTTSRIHKPKSNQPYGILMGVYDKTFWGESTDVLGYYATKEDLENEMAAIYQAIANGHSAYQLQYTSKVDRKLFLV